MTGCVTYALGWRAVQAVWDPCAGGVLCRGAVRRRDACAGGHGQAAGREGERRRRAGGCERAGPAPPRPEAAQVWAGRGPRRPGPRGGGKQEAGGGAAGRREAGRAAGVRVAGRLDAWPRPGRRCGEARLAPAAARTGAEPGAPRTPPPCAGRAAAPALTREPEAAAACGVSPGGAGPGTRRADGAGASGLRRRPEGGSAGASAPGRPC